MLGVFPKCPSGCLSSALIIFLKPAELTDKLIKRYGSALKVVLKLS
jgi:hypothetical protein